MDKQKFFAALRKRDSGLFGTSLGKGQVEGIEAILSAARGLPVSYAAYCLGTAYHETGRAMAPNVENMNYSIQGLLSTFGRHRISESDARRYGRASGRPANQRMIANIVYGGPWGKKNLGNIEPDDGWNFRGHGMVHITGRRNFTRASARLNVDMIHTPSRALEIDIAAKCLVIGMVEGWYTGLALERYLPGDYIGARRTVNGTDRAVDIAGYAQSFENALRAAGWTEGAVARIGESKPAPAPKKVAQPKAAPATGAKPSIVAVVIAVILAIAAWMGFSN